LQRYQVPLTAITDRNSDAAAVLTAKGWRVFEHSGDSVSVQISSDADVAAINRCLLEHGIQVFRLDRRQATLENLFLRLVATHEPGATA
jgi:hypothetical protein